MDVKEYVQYDCLELAHKIKSGETSAQEALQCAFTRLEEINPKLNAIIATCEDLAQAQLQQLTGQEPFYGVPLLVKDLGFSLKGSKESEGSRFFQNNITPDHSVFIERLLQAGFIPFAKTNTAELGLSYVTEPELFGPCLNPYDPSRTPGGSSGGSAAAVKMGVAPIATASDGGGSIRIPAACCGLFGLKPSAGVMPPASIRGESWSGVASHHVLTRTINDSSLVFDWLTHDLLRTQQAVCPPKLKIVKVQGIFADVPLDLACLAAVEQAEQLLRRQGHSVETITLKLPLNEIGACSLNLIAASVHTMVLNQEKYLGRKVREDELEPITYTFYQQGRNLSAADLLTAKATIHQHLAPLHKLFARYDVLLSPALAQLPLKIGELSTRLPMPEYLQKNTAFCPYASLFNQAGLPACTLPIIMADGLPISVQLAAGSKKDALLFALAKTLTEDPALANLMRIL